MKKSYKEIEKFAQTNVKGDVRRMLGAILATAENKGGHAIWKHIGKSEEEMQKRFEEEKKYITSFYDSSDAEKYVEMILTDEWNQLDIAEWLLNNADFTDLVLLLPEETDEYTGHVIGRNGLYMTDDVCVVLKKWVNNKGDVEWSIKTAYPSKR